jgi:hypothetical protein
VFGGEQPSPARRVERLAEFVEVIDRLLRERAVSHTGEHYVVNDARMIPGCVQRPRVPIALAASGRRTLGLVARFADAWITHGDTGHSGATDAEVEAMLRQQLDGLAAACDAAGRDPMTIERIYLAGADGDRPLASLDTFDAFVGRCERLGFTDVVFHDPRPDDPVWDDAPEIVEEIAVWRAST